MGEVSEALRPPGVFTDEHEVSVARVTTEAATNRHTGKITG